ncbi:hypothetical protein AGLY_017004 [Aphis glycines]|uniref:Uncharacterized protein n=1 Tax=Aphis glycines TaxID=307491 RepID=A0A6G0SWE5_APHGL|nr:hypothetical protein AGLY_017004 [Aphis glycines]
MASGNSSTTQQKQNLYGIFQKFMMKVKQKIGMSYKGKHKSDKKIKKRTLVAKKVKIKKNPNGKRLILTPGQTGGAILLIPIFAGLSALGSLMSGSASEKKLMNTLPNRPLTSGDIIKYIVKFNINNFRGVFSRDDLPKKPRTIECGIVNLDVSSGDGSHWVAFYKLKDKVVYFDSFGDLLPPIELQNYFKGNTIIYNYSNYQDFNSFNCAINVYDDLEIALLNLQTYNTFPNINETNNHFEIHLENLDCLLKNNKFPTCYITLKKGCYGIKDIKNQILTQIDDFYNDNEYIEIKLTEKITFDIGIDQVDFKTTIFSKGTIRFNVKNNKGPLLGFEKKIMNHACNTLMVILHRNVNSIKVMCNIAQGSFNNHMPSHSIYEFSPTENIGTKLIQTPTNLIYYKLNK